MKKYLVFLLFVILVSCEKDLLEPLPDPTSKMIFDMGEVLVQDGQDISFEVITNTQHELIITKQDGSVISKEVFQPQIGINTRKIYTKSLPKETLILSLWNDEQISNISIIVE